MKGTTQRTVTIASGASLSGAVLVPAGHKLIGIIMPGTWTAAGITFAASMSESGTYRAVWKGNTEYTITSPLADQHQIFTETDGLAGPSYLKIRSGTSGTPVNQAADRVLTLVFAPK